MYYKKKVKEFLKTEVEDFKEGVADDESLIDAGIIDSLVLLTLISFLEEEFSITPNDDELDIENFDSINSIANFIKEKKIS